jgi:CheY-like chemotaxis protein
MGEPRPKTVLYVDDEPDIREVVEMSLSVTGGLNVHTCASGEQALDEISRIAPDLILLDVMMPGLDGPSTLQRIRTMPRFERTPVVFMTAKALPQEVARFKSLGAVAVIPKPFDPISLSRQLLSIWEGLSHE